jgi:hypothetical protein
MWLTVSQVNLIIRPGSKLQPERLKTSTDPIRPLRYHKRGPGASHPGSRKEFLVLRAMLDYNLRWRNEGRAIPPNVSTSHRKVKQHVPGDEYMLFIYYPVDCTNDLCYCLLGKQMETHSRSPRQTNIA